MSDKEFKKLFLKNYGKRYWAYLQTQPYQLTTIKANIEVFGW